MMKIVDAANFSTRRDVETGTETQRAAVLDILQAVKQEGDAAVRRFTEQFDRIQLPEMRVTEDEFKEALCAINPEVRDAIREAAVNIRDYHSRQMRQSWMTTHESERYWDSSSVRCNVSDFMFRAVRRHIRHPYS